MDSQIEYDGRRAEIDINYHWFSKESITHIIGDIAIQEISTHMYFYTQMHWCE